jgi:GNAT superfamily N-acetyltransferase
MTNNEINITSIADHLHHVPTIARWHWDEWGHTDPTGSLQAWTDGLATRTNRDRIPTTYLALKDANPIASTTLVEHDMSTHRDLTPWLAGVYVKPEHRRHGIGAALVTHTMHKAAEMGVKRLYLYTNSARDFYLKLGWTVLTTDLYEARTVTVMAVDLPRNEP